MQTGPASRAYFSQRLRLHYVDWGNEGAPLMLMVHGGRDHCRNWDWVAEALRHDYHVVAPDLRGHGDSQWLVGGSYTHMDFAYDIAQLVHQVASDKVTIIGHSLGGSVSLMYAGMYPELVEKLIVIEGLGPSKRMRKMFSKIPHHERMRIWVNDLRSASARLPKRYPTLEDAFKRMQAENPHLSTEQARHLTLHGANCNEDGTYSWKFDNYVRVFSPGSYRPEEHEAFHVRIQCPVLLVQGAQSEFCASEEEFSGRFGNLRVETFANAGHWVHHDQLAQFLQVTRDFLSAPSAPEATPGDAPTA